MVMVSSQLRQLLFLKAISRDWQLVNLDTLSKPKHLLLHPLNKLLLCSECGYSLLLAVLEILQCRESGDVKSSCQGLVDGGIDSCKDTRALGWGKGQPCITASEVVLLERGAQGPARPSPRPSHDLMVPGSLRLHTTGKN